MVYVRTYESAVMTSKGKGGVSCGAGGRGDGEGAHDVGQSWVKSGSKLGQNWVGPGGSFGLAPSVSGGSRSFPHTHALTPNSLRPRLLSLAPTSLLPHMSHTRCNTHPPPQPLPSQPSATLPKYHNALAPPTQLTPSPARTLSRRIRPLPRSPRARTVSLDHRSHVR